MANNVPCRNCVNRHLACHDTCEKYIEWHKEMSTRKRKYGAPKGASPEARTRHVSQVLKQSSTRR